MYLRIPKELSCPSLHESGVGCHLKREMHEPILAIGVWYKLDVLT